MVSSIKPAIVMAGIMYARGEYGEILDPHALRAYYDEIKRLRAEEGLPFPNALKVALEEDAKYWSADRYAAYKGALAKMGNVRKLGKLPKGIWWSATMEDVERLVAKWTMPVEVSASSPNQPQDLHQAEPPTRPCELSRRDLAIIRRGVRAMDRRDFRNAVLAYGLPRGCVPINFVSPDD